MKQTILDFHKIKLHRWYDAQMGGYALRWFSQKFDAASCGGLYCYIPEFFIRPTERKEKK